MLELDTVVAVSTLYQENDINQHVEILWQSHRISLITIQFGSFFNLSQTINVGQSEMLEL